MNEYYLVTVKLPKNSEHDPIHKLTGKCPLDKNKICTDVTGQHHTILVLAPNIGYVREALQDRYHITRIEKVHTVELIHESQDDRRADSA